MKHHYIKAMCGLFFLANSCQAVEDDTPDFKDGFNPALESHVLHAIQLVDTMIEDIEDGKTFSPDELQSAGILEIAHSFIVEDRKQISPPLISPQKAVASLTRIAQEKRAEVGPTQPFSPEIGYEMIASVQKDVLFTPTKGPNGANWYCLKINLSELLPEDFSISPNFAEVLDESRKEEGRTNIMRLLAGVSPVVRHTTEHEKHPGRHHEILNAHHLSQRADGEVLCMSRKTHTKCHGMLHGTVKSSLSPVDHVRFNSERGRYYQNLGLTRTIKWLYTLKVKQASTPITRSPKKRERPTGRSGTPQLKIPRKDEIVRKLVF